MQTMDVSDISALRPVPVRVAGPVYVTPSSPSLPFDTGDPPTVDFEPLKATPTSKSDLPPSDSETTGRAAAAELSKRSGSTTAVVKDEAALGAVPAAPRRILTRRIERVAALLAVSSIAILLGGRFLLHPGKVPAPPAPPAPLSAGPAKAVPSFDLGSPQNPQGVAAEPAVRSILWSIDSVPPGADVIRAADNELIGRTPWRFQGPAKPGSLALRLRFPGFKEQRLTLDTSDNAAQSVTLQRKKSQRLPPQEKPQNPLPIMD
jgi:hypothetical protein